MSFFLSKYQKNIEHRKYSGSNTDNREDSETDDDDNIINQDGNSNNNNNVKSKTRDIQISGKSDNVKTAIRGI